MQSPQNYKLSQVPLDDLLLALEVTKSSVDLLLESTVGRARLSVLEGRLDDATFGDQEGPDAVLSMLSLKDGQYELSAKLSNTKGLNKSLAKIVQQKMRSSGPLDLSQSPAQPPVAAPLERTNQSLPSGLGPVELRALALINGSLSALDIAAREKSSAAESLSAIRRLASLGLVRAAKRGTLALGTRVALTSNKDTLHSLPSMAPHQEQPAEDDGVELGMSAKTADLENSLRQRKSSSNKPVPARMRRSDVRKTRGTGYSSVPPPSLAEERVNLPGSLRVKTDEDNKPSAQPKVASKSTGLHSTELKNTELKNTALKSRDPSSVPPLVAPQEDKPVRELELSAPSAFQESGALESSAQMSNADESSSFEPKPARSGQIHNALNAATVLPDEGLYLERSFSGEPLDSSITQESPFSDVTAEAPHPRPRMDSDEIGPDPVVVSAAQGQLRDSELPVPSTRLGQAALDQLDELNDAVVSSRKPSLPNLKISQEYSQDLQAPGSVPHPDLLPGEAAPASSNLPTVGRYEVLARLKRGGMGSVYMCRLSGSAGFRRHFAMKVLHGHLAEQPEALDSFFHEARVLAGLHHRNIVGIADVGTPTEPYFVLEYVEGGSLSELYRATKNGRDAGVVVSVILDALNGLAAAHEAEGDEGEPLELVHCDVTPHNLLVGIDGTCRVTDFGIARTAKEPGGKVTRGKPGYIAPERLARKPSDHRSDLFSLGVVLYSGLTGVEPFAGETAEETMRNILDKDVIPPSEVGFRPPPSLDWVCMKALSRDPDQRFQSADEMAQQLRRIAGREGLLGSPRDVAEWVSESLAPTLSARRAASMRGTSTESSRFQESSIPPSAEEPGVAPLPSPSAAENTGPLEPPASSHNFADNTEILGGGQSKKKVEEAGASRGRTWTAYGALALAMLALVWVALSPGAFANFIHMVRPPAKAKDTKAEQPSEAQKAPAPAAPVAPKKSKPAEQDGIVIPDIVPSGGE